MADKHPSIVQQTLLVDVLALDTLAGRTAILLRSFSAITATFLMHRLRYFLQYVARTADDDGPLLVGIAKGDASLAEIAAAMIEANTIGPGDTSQVLTQDETWVVYQNTVKAFNMSGGVAAERFVGDDWIKFGGKNGIPALEGTGFQLFAFNAGSGALSTGSSVNGLVHVQGRWLRD